jgi:hypothetical protein
LHAAPGSKETGHSLHLDDAVHPVNDEAVMNNEPPSVRYLTQARHVPMDEAPGGKEQSAWLTLLKG